MGRVGLGHDDRGARVRGFADLDVERDFAQEIDAEFRRLALRAAMGDYFVEIYGKIKLGEYKRFEATVPALDLAWYLRSV